MEAIIKASATRSVDHSFSVNAYRQSSQMVPNARRSIQYTRRFAAATQAADTR